ncbi:hypothetical protein ABIA39_004383 [Nocardia sp. GAS34]
MSEQTEKLRDDLRTRLRVAQDESCWAGAR